MLYTASNIVKDVRVALDENDTLTALISSDSDTLTLDQIIIQKIPHAVRDISLAAPASMLSDAPALPTVPIQWDGFGNGHITLPVDFLRLVSFRMSDWQKAVTGIITETDARYSQQHSIYSGVRGNAIKPIVAIVETANGRRLEFFSCDSETAVVALAKYVADPEKISDEIEVCRDIYKAVLYYASALTAAAVGNAAAEGLFKIANDQLSA